MEPRTTGLALLALGVVLLSVTQIIIKSRLNVHGAIPVSASEIVPYVWGLLQDLRFLGGLGLLIIAAFCWYAGLSRIPLSLAFPFAAMSYPLIFLGSVLLLNETFSWPVAIGNILIVTGVLLVAATATNHA